MANNIRYIKLGKNDISGSSINTFTLAEAEQLKVITPDLTSSIFTIKNITNKLEYLLLEVDSEPSGALNISRNTKILNYSSFRNQNLITSSYSAHTNTWVPLKFGSANVAPPLPDFSGSLTIPVIYNSGSFTTNAYYFGKTPNVSLMWELTLTASFTDGDISRAPSYTDDVYFAMYIFNGNFAESSETSLGTTGNTSFNIPFSPSLQEVTVNNSIPQFFSITASTNTADYTKLYLTGSFRADFVKPGTYFIPVFKNTNGSSTNKPRISFTGVTWSLNFDPMSTQFTGSNIPVASSPSASNILVEPYFTSKFQNSDYEVLLNNYNENRLNTFLQDVDYSTNATLPINLNSIISGSATKAQTPDSNYTARRIIRPRYDGSRIFSAKYNQTTPSSSLITFLNGDTGSWGGDNSYGLEPVVNKYPSYLGRFTSAKESRTLWGAAIIELEAVYGVPNFGIGSNYEPASSESIKPLQAPSNPFTLTTSSNPPFPLMSNAFEKNTQISIIFDSGSYTSTGTGSDGNFPTLVKTTLPIIESGTDYQLIATSQASRITTLTTESFRLPAWADLISSRNSLAISSTQSFSGTTNCFLLTGSGFFLLSGSAGSYKFPDGNTTFSGSLLGIMHHLNYILFNTQLGGNNPTSPTLTINGNLQTPLPTNYAVLEKTQYSNYFRFDPLNSQAYSSSLSGSVLSEFKTTANGYIDNNLPFVILPGDTIRIRINAQSGDFNTTGSRELYFNVTSISQNTSSVLINGSTPTNITGGLYQQINVSPNPSSSFIPNGRILEYTIIRTVRNANTVIVPISGLLPNGKGVIVPADFSLQQQENTNIIINNLQAKNAF